jgi:hypothetical protein
VVIRRRARAIPPERRKKKVGCGAADGTFSVGVGSDSGRVPGWFGYLGFDVSL